MTKGNNGMSGEPALTSRHWIGECPNGNTLTRKFTEVVPGQFVGRPHEPQTVPCWMHCPPTTRHTLYPCTAEQYEDAGIDADHEPGMMA